MARMWFCFLAVTAFSCPARGQKVEMQKPDPGRIVHVKTALEHLSVLEMSEPVSAVAAGSSAFKVEWRENKVFIEPTESDVATNLFVWTASGRFNYELDPPGAVQEMVFAIDQPIADPPKIAVSSKPATAPADLSPADVLIATKSVRFLGPSAEMNRVAVYITNLLEHDGQVLIRYSIRNGTDKPYMPGRPQVVALKAPRYRQSLYALKNYQLSSREAPRMTSKGEIAIDVARNEIRSSRIEPGQETTGIATVKLPLENAEPWVIRLFFVASSKGAVGATVVL